MKYTISYIFLGKEITALETGDETFAMTLFNQLQNLRYFPTCAVENEHGKLVKVMTC